MKVEYQHIIDRKVNKSQNISPRDRCDNLKLFQYISSYVMHAPRPQFLAARARLPACVTCFAWQRAATHENETEKEEGSALLAGGLGGRASSSVRGRAALLTKAYSRVVSERVFWTVWC